MCDFEEFIFTCGHSVYRLKSHCHQARNTEGHRCRRVKKLRNVWDQDYPCDDCRSRLVEMNQQQQAAQAQAHTPTATSNGSFSF